MQLLRHIIIYKLKNQLKSQLSNLPTFFYLFTLILLIFPLPTNALPASALNNAIAKLNPLLSALHLQKIIIDDNTDETEPSQTEPTKFGTLKLCPPGGRSFFEAFQMACPMRRKRRSVDSLMSDEEMEIPKFSQQQKALYRPATIDEIMRICCERGCEFTDFFPHCGPFADW